MEERFYLLSLKGADGQGEDFWLASILKGLDQERRNRIQSIKNPRKRLESAGAGLLLQLALQEALLSKREEETVSSLTLQELLDRAGEPLPLHFAYGVQGKPYVTNYPYFFSLSHSGDYVLCAFPKGRSERISSRRGTVLWKDWQSVFFPRRKGDGLPDMLRRGKRRIIFMSAGAAGKPTGS